MHIAEGALTLPVLATGMLMSAAGITIGLRQLSTDRVPLAAMMAATFFVGSLIHLPAGLSSIHLVLNGLCGILLGWVAFPVIFIGLSLQMLMFGFGGLTPLGVNTVIMALPAVICYYLFGQNLTNYSHQQVFWRGFLAGSVAIILGIILLNGALYWAGEKAFLELMMLIGFAYLPVAIVEGLVTATIVGFLYRVQPALLNLPAYLAQRG
ncbi:cobalt transporter CbiM [Thioflexithrix psekupsensis]|uniref:Cobalamin biosynthesis protein CbiM n=1 Tax=Thioflexithrix psekupsensis TaxID=1570016 RepID=A0A251XAQ7_9GAMM|nr:cobalt transporter CbiM [Thioflexithrix psekupsensis]OUD15017.1 cobalamin biosynthesis protein CbiM [Thioflexithrix psekupsensis]